MSVGLGLGSPGTVHRLLYHERCCLLHSVSDVCEGICVNLSKPVVRKDEDRQGSVQLFLVAGYMMGRDVGRRHYEHGDGLGEGATHG